MILYRKRNKFLIYSLFTGGIRAPTMPPDGDTFDPSYCSVKLPPPQPLAPPTDDATHR